MRRVSLGKTLLVGAVVALVGLGANAAASFLTDWTKLAPWLAVPVIAVIVAWAQALASATFDGDGAATVGPPTGGGPLPGASRTKGTPLAVTLVVAVLVIGVAGFVLTFGVRYAVGWITGNETGTERLVGAASTETDGLRVTVHSLQETRHFMRAEVTVNNQSSVTISIPLYQNCALVGGTSIPADDFRSDWPTTFAPTGRVDGTIIFTGKLSDTVRKARLDCATLFPQGPGPTSLTVPMALRAP